MWKEPFAKNLMHISQIKVNFETLENEGFNKWGHYSIDTMFILIC